MSKIAAGIALMARTDTQATPLAIAGRRLAQLRAEVDLLDIPGETTKPEWQAAVSESDTLIEAMGLQPVTLRDAATLALCISEQVGLLCAFDISRDDAQPYYDRIATAAAGILLVFRNMNMPLAELGPIDADYEISRHSFMPSLACQAGEEGRVV